MIVPYNNGEVLEHDVPMRGMHNSVRIHQSGRDVSTGMRRGPAFITKWSRRIVTSQVGFDTLDADGANMGTCLANTNTINANGKWKFEAMCLDDSDAIAEVRFKEISGF